VRAAEPARGGGQGRPCPRPCPPAVTSTMCHRAAPGSVPAAARTGGRHRSARWGARSTCPRPLHSSCQPRARRAAALTGGDIPRRAPRDPSGIWRSPALRRSWTLRRIARCGVKFSGHLAVPGCRAVEFPDVEPSSFGSGSFPRGSGQVGPMRRGVPRSCRLDLARRSWNCPAHGQRARRRRASSSVASVSETVNMRRPRSR
jgi:hypothetical protein